MKQRFITGAGLVVFLATMLWLPNWCMALATIICVGLAVWEEYHALTLANHRVVSWPTWVVMGASVPLTHFFGAKVIIPLLAGAMLMMVVQVLFRKEPELTDLSMSTLPLLTVALPGLSLVAMAMVDQKALEVVLLSLTFAVPLVGDIFALFIGSAVGGAIGQIGDLFASLVKRHSGIKDFSNLFPGHGGMLDRLDSVLFMAILMYCYRLFAA